MPNDWKLRGRYNTLESMAHSLRQQLESVKRENAALLYMADDPENGKIDAVRYDRTGRPIEDCTICRLTFRANYRAGLWEMVWFTTKALTVPEEFCPAEKRKRQA